LASKRSIFQLFCRILGAGVAATEKWQQLQVSVGLGVIAAGPQVQQVNGQIVLKTKDVNIGVTASDSLATKKIGLGLSFGFHQGALSPLKVDVGAVITDGKATGGTLDASLKTPYGDFGLKGQDENKKIQGLVNWTVHFN
jgi:hypothetical protein